MVWGRSFLLASACLVCALAADLRPRSSTEDGALTNALRSGRNRRSGYGGDMYSGASSYGHGDYGGHYAKTTVDVKYGPPHYKYDYKEYPLGHSYHSSYDNYGSNSYGGYGNAGYGGFGNAGYGSYGNAGYGSYGLGSYDGYGNGNAGYSTYGGYGNEGYGSYGSSGSYGGYGHDSYDNNNGYGYNTYG